LPPCILTVKYWRTLVIPEELQTVTDFTENSKKEIGTTDVAQCKPITDKVSTALEPGC